MDTEKKKQTQFWPDNEVNYIGLLTSGRLREKQVCREKIWSSILGLLWTLHGFPYLPFLWRQ